MLQGVTPWIDKFTMLNTMAPNTACFVSKHIAKRTMVKVMHSRYRTNENDVNTTDSIAAITAM